MARAVSGAAGAEQAGEADDLARLNFEARVAQSAANAQALGGEHRGLPPSRRRRTPSHAAHGLEIAAQHRRDKCSLSTSTIGWSSPCGRRASPSPGRRPDRAHRAGG